MEKAIEAIQNTPVPTLLIVAGLFFLLLGFVTKLGGLIEVSQEQKRWAIPIGLLVLTLGMVLYFTPAPSPSFVVENVGLPPSASSDQSDTASNPDSDITSDQTLAPIETSGSNQLSDSQGFSAGADLQPGEKKALINDPDGYTWVRSGPGTDNEIVTRVIEGEEFYVIPQGGEWWPVRTKSNKYGYMHRSRIEAID